jgi:hypothetical protein
MTRTWLRMYAYPSNITRNSTNHTLPYWLRFFSDQKLSIPYHRKMKQSYTDVSLFQRQFATGLCPVSFHTPSHYTYFLWIVMFSNLFQRVRRYKPGDFLIKMHVSFSPCTWPIPTTPTFRITSLSRQLKKPMCSHLKSSELRENIRDHHEWTKNGCGPWCVRWQWKNKY